MDTSYLFYSGVFAIIFIFSVGVLSLAQTSQTRLPLPPGPKGSIISGVAGLMPKLEPWKTYASWSRHFGDPIISFRVYNRIIVVLNDVTSVRNLLEKRAHIYSDRPVSWMYNTICDRGKAIFNVSSLDERHKQYRKLLKTGLGVRATRDFWPLLQTEVETLVEGLTRSPEKHESHIRRNAAGVIMKVAFGYTVTEDDHFIKVAEEAAKVSGWATAPGRWLVDYIPTMRFIPSWVPGADWKRQGEAWRARLRHLSHVPHQWVKDQMASGTYIDSFTSRLLRPDGHQFVNAEQEDIIKWCAGGLYAGAGDTTVSALISFIHLMALHPEVQRKAQIEIDDIIGVDQLPDPPKLGKLPYLAAVLKEVLRFAPVGNIALPHRVIVDDEYAGYRIPKDATIIANVWAIMHDVSIYSEPFIFNPDRFFAPSGNDPQTDPRQFAFGFGHRSCPGIHFAETTMLLAMANVISQFDISLPSNTKVPPTIEYTSGITSHIKPFDIQITPRTNNKA
ncbi:cytochrome P450 [Crucibulum laeve]|uniref:Cytochrome P450 n=1 Tax=Crucibulum laeve TaxID=68775 RepID=A0A5C3M8X6_9AGAR|nr:cytochrome P450 [Crucibulum laeve]